MELYDKKFLIYGNCMTRSFGHPGLLDPIKFLFDLLNRYYENVFFSR